MTQAQQHREDLIRAVVRHAHIDRMTEHQIAKLLGLRLKRVREINASAFAEALRGYVYCCEKAPRNPRAIAHDMERQGISPTTIRRTLGSATESAVRKMVMDEAYRQRMQQEMEKRRANRQLKENRFRRLIELYSEGHTIAAAAAMVKVARSTAGDYLKRVGVIDRRREAASQ